MKVPADFAAGDLCRDVFEIERAMRTLYRRRDIVDINRIGHRSARDADLPDIFAPLKVHSAFDVAESCDRDPLRTHKINRSVAEFELADLNPEVPRHGIFD